MPRHKKVSRVEVASKEPLLPSQFTLQSIANQTFADLRMTINEMQASRSKLEEYRAETRRLLVLLEGEIAVRDHLLQTARARAKEVS